MVIIRIFNQIKAIVITFEIDFGIDVLIITCHKMTQSRVYNRGGGGL
jgi:hypothetical protein